MIKRHSAQSRRTGDETCGGVRLKAGAIARLLPRVHSHEHLHLWRCVRPNATSDNPFKGFSGPPTITPLKIPLLSLLLSYSDLPEHAACQKRAHSSAVRAGDS